MKLSKAGQVEWLSFQQHLQKRPQPGYPPEDLMEQAADRLEDPGIRVFFMTVVGFVRLAQVVVGASSGLAERCLPWVARHFRIPAGSELESGLVNLMQRGLAPVNLNITFKRLTAILPAGDRAIVADGLLDLVGEIAPHNRTMIKSVLSKLLLSERAARELIEKRGRLSPDSRG